MRIISTTLLGVMLLAGTAQGQSARVKRFTAPLAGHAVLKDVDDKYNAQVSSLEMPEPDAAAEQQHLRDIKARVRQAYPYRKSAAKKKTTSAMAPVVDINFIADTSSQIPPDNYMSVSAGNKAVAVMNGTIAIHDATSGNYLLRKGLLSFSAAVGLNNSFGSNYNYRFDPKIVYDPSADRFICVMLNGTNEHNWIVLGFSQSNDPMAGWNFYKFYGDYTGDTTWFDYPAISITQNEFFLTGNKIKYDSSWQAGFTRSLIYQVRKQDGYNGDTALTYQIWDSVTYNNKYLRCLYPLNPGDSLLGPSQYFLSNRNFDLNNDSVFIVKVPDTIGSADTVLTVTAVAATSGSYGAPPDARQPDTAYTLATNDARVLGGFIKGNEIQYVNESVNPANGASAVYLGVISNFQTAPTMTGRLFSIDSLDFGYPNISYAGSVGGANQSIISFEYSGPATNPGYAAILFDGSNFSDMVNIHSGDSSIKMLNQKEQRWGDYSGSQPDWTTLGAVWVEGIYGRKNRQYGNYMARLTSPYRVSTPSAPSKHTSPSLVYPNPAFEFLSFGFTVSQEQSFSFVIYDMQGHEVAKILDNFCREGQNVIQLNIASLAPGTYFLKALGSKGENIEVHTFVRK